MGTLIYISPEVLKNCEYTTKNDVYAFSMLFYEIITGNEPFVGENHLSVMFSVLQGVRPTIPQSVPEKCQDLISRCWSEDPDERPAFEEIVNISENDPKSFINGDFDEECFNEYVNLIKYI